MGSSRGQVWTEALVWRNLRVVIEFQRMAGAASSRERLHLLLSTLAKYQALCVGGKGKPTDEQQMSSGKWLGEKPGNESPPSPLNTGGWVHYVPVFKVNFQLLYLLPTIAQPEQTSWRNKSVPSSDAWGLIPLSLTLQRVTQSPQQPWATEHWALVVHIKAQHSLGSPEIVQCVISFKAAAQEIHSLSPRLSTNFSKASNWIKQTMPSEKPWSMFRFTRASGLGVLNVLSAWGS